MAQSIYICAYIRGERIRRWKKSLSISTLLVSRGRLAPFCHVPSSWSSCAMLEWFFIGFHSTSFLLGKVNTLHCSDIDFVSRRRLFLDSRIRLDWTYLERSIRIFKDFVVSQFGDWESFVFSVFSVFFCISNIASWYFLKAILTFWNWLILLTQDLFC